MIELRKLFLSYGDKTLLRDASAVIGARDRVGLTGPNGSGKTTLLRILMGAMQPDSGGIIKAGYATLGWLPQETVARRGISVKSEIESAFPSITATRARLEEAAAQLAAIDPGHPQYQQLLEWIAAMEARLEHAEEDRLNARMETVLAGLGFAAGDADRDCGEFSGGWQMRIALAKLLLHSPSLLLLDEPTNHLDIASLHWLEKYLGAYPGALLIVSHDRAFLDQLTRRTLALEHGRLQSYAGNFSYYERESAARLALALQARKKQDRKLQQTERFIERFRYKNTKATQVQSRIKQLDKIERIEIDDSVSEIHFRFPPAPRAGQRVLELENLHKAYGQIPVFAGIDLVIERGDRIAVVGNNGAGKSTLMRILAGEESYQGGSLSLGHNVRMAYFAQHQAEVLDPEADVIGTMEASMTAAHNLSARDILGAFLFSGDEVFKKVKVLSGGEKSRLALARMLAQSANLLLLDEPTNHLDIRSKDRLRKALREYDGALVVVSHDRDFLDPLIDKVLEISPGACRWFHGNLSQYLSDLDAQAAISQGQTTAEKAKDSGPENSPKARRQAVALRNRQLAPLRKQSEALEQQLHALEAELAKLNEAMADPELYKNAEKARHTLQRHKDVKSLIDSMYKEWEQVEASIAACSTG